MRIPASAVCFSAISMSLGGCGGQPRIAFTPVPLHEDTAVSLSNRPVANMQTQIDVLVDAPVEIEQAAPLTEAEVAAIVPRQSVAATLPPQPLSQFIETAFGQILNVPYIAGPGVAQRRDIVSMSGPREMPSEQFLRLVEKALNQYGLVMMLRSGAIIIREAPARPPKQQEGSKPHTIHVAALGNVSAEPAAELVSDVSEGGGVDVQIAPEVNGIVLKGEDSAVSQARGLLHGIDRPEFAGMRVARIAPTLWNAEALASALREVLANEGFMIGVGGSGGTSLIHLSSPDCLLLFSDDARAFNRVLYWAAQLDSLDGAGGDRAGYFVYQVKNTNAAELGGLIARINGGGDAADVTDRSMSGPKMDIAAMAIGRRGSNGKAQPTAGGFEVAATPEAGQTVVDTTGNRILFRGTRREYAQIFHLLRDLDVAPKQVLVEITIAEVTLTDETRFGMEWHLDHQFGSGSLAATTVGGLVREPGALGLTFARGFSQSSVQAALNAIATNQNLNILSTPKLLARSGGQAQILIGNDVPVITSQRAADIQSNGDTDILQTVQYRQTGVILNIRPVVLNDNRIDIEIFQEVSSQQPNVTSAIGSPVISNRSITTRLALREGMTAVLGGLIQDSQSKGQSGVPFLKDIPLLGQAFRTDSASTKKTELLILVTPKLIKDDNSMNISTLKYSDSINKMISGRGQRTYTLIPWNMRGTIPSHQHFN